MMELRAGQARGRGLPVKKEFVWIPYEQLSPCLVRAVVASEDVRFFRHYGVDWPSTLKAARLNWRDRKMSHGASTINQQLAKNLFLSPSKSFARKLHEALIAWEMEFILSERRRLELYLNVIEWGDGVYGAEAAARYYFNVSAASLSVEQSTLLAAIIPAPRDGRNTIHTGEVRERALRIRQLMHHPLLDDRSLDDLNLQK